MRDKLATGLSLLALIFVAFLHLRVTRIQVANTHEIEGEIRTSDVDLNILHTKELSNHNARNPPAVYNRVRENADDVSDFDLNIPHTKELTNRNVRNSPSVIHNHNENVNEESETTPTVRIEIKASKTSTKNLSPSRTLKTSKALAARETDELSAHPFIPLSKQTVEDVEKFVFFIGYPRSGHSIIASLMDAHPNMVIAHQYNVFGEWVKGNTSKNLQLQDKQFLFNELYKDSWYQVTSGWRTAKNNVKGYTLHTDSPWQGRYKQLQVIGDKDAALTSWAYYRFPDQFKEGFYHVKESIGIPIRAIHVVRNPYDMIATHLLYKVTDRAGRRLKTATETNKYNNTRLLQIGAINVFREVNAVESMTEALKLNVLEIHNVNFVKNPRGTMLKICDFLEIDCPEDYLEMCEKKAFDKVSITRNLVYWSKELLSDVEKRVKLHRFFDRYSFDSDF